MNYSVKPSTSVFKYVIVAHVDDHIMDIGDT